MTLLDEIKRLRELSEKATAGPWSTVESGPYDARVRVHVEPTICKCYRAHTCESDAAFIAASRTALPKLCDELEKAVDILKFIHKELGVPQPRYPEPVAHASDVAAILLKEWGVE